MAFLIYILILSEFNLRQKFLYHALIWVGCAGPSADCRNMGPHHPTVYELEK